MIKNYLFSRIRRQVKDQDGEKSDAYARNDQIDGVEQSLPSHSHVESYVYVEGSERKCQFLTFFFKGSFKKDSTWIRFLATREIFFILLCRNFKYIPII